MPLPPMQSGTVTDQIEQEVQAIAAAGIQPEITPQDKLLKDIQEEEDKILQDFGYAKSFLNSMISNWTSVEAKTDSNRMTRDIEVNVDSLRQSGDLDEDEAFIPDRVIDSNIQREIPSYINFLKNSNRIAIFKDRLDETFDTELLERAFTQGMTYKGWIKPFFKTIDSSLTHGWASIEVVYDTKFPLNVGLEYIAHEDLIFPLDSKDINTSSTILRRYKVTPLQLKTWVFKFGFSLEQVNLIIEKYKDKADKDKTIQVFKRLCKHNNCVYVSWFSNQGACTDWLKKPLKLDLGISEQKDVVVKKPQQIPQYDATGIQTGFETQMIDTTEKQWVPVEIENYPIFVLPYRETEKPMLFDYIGRVSLDKDKQEAQTCLITSFINGLNRAQRIYASMEDATNDGKPAKQLANIKWSQGTIFDKKVNFFNFPYPDPIVLKAAQYMDTTNSEEIGQTNFAAINREDSRKTATEITAAEKAQLLLNSVDLTLFSEFIRDIYSFSWLIVRSQALQDKIKFLLVPMEVAQGMDITPQPMGQAPQQMAATQSAINSLGSFQQEMSHYVNDYDTIIRNYDVRAAGDVDVIQKQEMESQMKQDWPVIANTPLAGRFLSDLMKLCYPENSALYSRILLEGNPKNQIIQALGAALGGILAIPEIASQLSPQDTKQLQSLQQESLQVLQIP